MRRLQTATSDINGEFKLNNPKQKQFEIRVGCLQFVFNFCVVLLLIYLFLNQVFDIRGYKDRAKFQRTSAPFVLRGEIVDRNGVKLASDDTSFNVYSHPKYYDNSPEKLADMLQPYLGISHNELVQKFSKDESVILIKKGIDRKTADKVKALGLREISLEVKNKRVYPQGSLASHILGYYNADADMAGGVEYVAGNYLKYIDKSIKYEKMPNGDIIYNLSIDPADVSAPVMGKTLKLTIDSPIQHICEKYLYGMVQKTNALRGAIIVLSPKTGEILALAAYPYYNPNNYAKHSLIEMKNWALTDVYPPGSTFKIITVASAMLNSKINKNTKIMDTGKMKIGWWEISNYDYRERGAPGLIDLVYLFQHSSNIGSIKIAQMMSAQEFYDALQLFGFGQRTGIDLPGESTGLLPEPSSWDAATHASMGYGYGSSVTAIQMISAVNAIANGGVWVMPHVIKYSDEEAEQKVIQRRIMTEEQASQMRDLLVASIEAGHSLGKMDDYYVAAKTGTSRRPNDNGVGYSNKLYTSMIGFLPASDPKVTIYVVIDSPQGGGLWGSTVAGPVFKDVATEIVRILNINPDKISEKENT
ncbi:MAG: penicillin-binding protein 2 [Candidatus Gastranaerophilales bacterium]|nr:penicillin-binding protein 2 [Candidatus Gastranaerophilales bacterium]